MPFQPQTRRLPYALSCIDPSKVASSKVPASAKSKIIHIFNLIKKFTSVMLLNLDNLTGRSLQNIATAKHEMKY